MELRDVPAKQLDGWVASTLQPSTAFTLAVKNTVRQIRVFKTVKGGSAGKGTALRKNSDADVVLFLSYFTSYLDQRQEHPKIRDLIEKRLLECMQSLSFTVRISPPRYKGRSLSLTLFSNTESIDVDILPTYDALGQVTEDGPPDPQVYVELLKAHSSPGEFSTCFTELQKKFVKRCPAKLKDLLRLVKHWYKQMLKPQYPRADLPPKYALELLTIYAWEQGTGSKEAFSLAEGFCTVLKLLCRYRDICVYWEKYYSLQHEQIGTHLKQLLRKPRPIILDPADPTGILGQDRQWDLVAEEAARCCASLPCLTGVNPWNVQMKEMIEREWRISRYQQRLSQQPAGTPLILQDNDSLASYGIYYDTTLVLLQTQPRQMDIFVKDIKNQTMTYTVQPTDTVLQLKTKINTRQGIPVQQQRLTYDSKNLENHHTLEHYNVQPKSTIFLLLQLRGGVGPQHPCCQPS
uniref:2'-5'-oligoadenylate synthetase like n=1 Tax=Anser cygnoides TaxID=8845 RepID=A0A8B9D3H7_ANSCY